LVAVKLLSIYYDCKYKYIKLDEVKILRKKKVHEDKSKVVAAYFGTLSIFLKRGFFLVFNKFSLKKVNVV
jgi:hypothetical protein